MGKKVAIVIPVYRNTLSDHEKISLKQGVTILNKYDFIFVAKDELDISEYENIAKEHNKESYLVLRFAEKHLQSIQAYSRLLISPKFYKSFKDYEYILIYQLDCFVFRDELEYWCDLDYDFIGSPVYEGFEQASYKSKFIGINGGLSLRKISSHIKVLNSFSYVFSFIELKKFYCEGTVNSMLLFIPKIVRDLTISNNTFHLFNNYQENEDLFWSIHANRNYSWFKVPGESECSKFGFELFPKKLLTLNDNKLPFGCHAWWKYDLKFWKPYINEFGYKI